MAAIVGATVEVIELAGVNVAGSVGVGVMRSAATVARSARVAVIVAVRVATIGVATVLVVMTGVGLRRVRVVVETLDLAIEAPAAARPVVLRTAARTTMRLRSRWAPRTFTGLPGLASERDPLLFVGRVAGGSVFELLSST